MRWIILFLMVLFLLRLVIGAFRGGCRAKPSRRPRLIPGSTRLP